MKETTEAAKLSAKDMIAKASKALWTPDATTMAVTITEARVTGIQLNNRLVWIVTVGPVRLIFRGPPGSPESGVGEATSVYDANTGEQLHSASRTYGRGDQ